MDDARTAQVAAVAALAEPTRRLLYEHVVRRPGAVSRDEAARATEVPRATVAFHLDKLVEEGLLDVVFERRTGRSGPGAGRPAKLYRRAGCDVAVSFPERHYDLAGGLLAAAMEEAQSTGEPPRAVLGRLAFTRGRELGAAARTGAPAAGSPDVALGALERHGFEPRVEGGAVTLANCPFHRLAREHTELVCGMNLRLLEGVLDGAGDARRVARLQPSPGRCCVRLEPADG
ncbi:helix-turn-helix transcriptional regulator [Blastococcus litoris]|uniref:helix-turn-helix transcriptional regulator n=1 Tax=Blastococcus litoris TaxID=2171622 RepID=UPI000E2FF8F3|nr:helix-turn-helix domain-containing protein [Blastococcus litoris]